MPPGPLPATTVGAPSLIPLQSFPRVLRLGDRGGSVALVLCDFEWAPALSGCQGLKDLATSTCALQSWPPPPAARAQAQHQVLLLNPASIVWKTRATG